MVRISKNSSHTNKRQIFDQTFNLNNRLLNRHFINVFLLVIILLVVSLYFFLLGIQEKDGMMTVTAHSASYITAHGKSNFLVYGTAWKKELTAKYVNQAIHTGFRFIDTACQPKHYNETGVGEGWTTAAKELGLERSDLYIQSKYTSYGGQDPMDVPYDHTAPLEEQVKTSLEVSLRNLQTTYLDTLVLHSPLETIEDTMLVWRTMETFVDQGKALRLGISNCYDVNMFKAIYEMARVKPAVLQNRFTADLNFDTELRAFVKSKGGIWYQSFWTLTASRHALANSQVQELAALHHLTPQTYMFAFLLSLGYVTPLSGTTSIHHMADDVAVMERIQGGEVFFETETDLRRMAQLLGMPDL